jgi:glycosyltransferase involved in cell wall biosynthesis
VTPVVASALQGSLHAMRVLFFNEGNLGGHILGQRQLDAALRAGMRVTPGVEARFVGLTPMGRVARALAYRPIPALSRGNLDLRALRWYLVQSVRARQVLEHELRRWSPDILHLHTQSVALLAVAIMRRLPVVLSVDTTMREWSLMPAWAESSGASGATAVSRALERRALREAALVLAWTGWARRGVEQEQPEANVIEHHPGLDLERYRPAARRPRDRPRVLFVGGRFREKGGEDLLEALDGGLGRDVDVDVVTPSAVAPRAGVRVHRLQASDPALLELYQQADLLCLPTYGDTNPWVLLEAMACGTPAVSTRVGAIPEMLDDGRAGVLVAHADPRSLREAIDGLLRDPQRRAELGGRARARCEVRYDARRQFGLLSERMRGLLEQPRTA